MEYGHSSDFQPGQYSPLEGKEGNRVPTKALTTLDTSELEKLIINNQMLNKKITNLIQCGVNLIESQNYNDAMAYFQEAENILEYAGSCGKALNKILITATLQNKACIFQRLWEQEKSYSYLEAIIYNQSNNEQSKNSQAQLEKQQHIASVLHHEQASAIYYFKFSAIASQIKNHEVALSSAFKGLKTIQSICKTTYQKLWKSTATVTEDMEKSMEILKQISEFEDKLEINKIDEYVSKSKQVLAEMKSVKQLKLSKQIVQMIESFTIGEVMQIFPVTIDELANVPSFHEQTSYVGSIFKALYFSIAFFAVATQLRFLTPSKIMAQKYSKCDELKKSQIYHLSAIYIAARFVPCPTKYLTHIIKSYSNHYQSEMKDYYDERIESQFRKISHKEKQKKNHRKQVNRESKEKRLQKIDQFETDVAISKPHHIGSIYKSKKSGMKVRNSSAQINGSKNKKSLAKQKSSCFIKQPPKYMKKSNDEHGFVHTSAETDEKIMKGKPKFQSFKVGKGTKSIQNKSSKSKSSKSPSVNLQKKKVKSPSKKAKKNAKFEQEYFQGDQKKEKKKKEMMSKLNENKQRFTNQYNHQEYLKSSTSKLEDLPKTSKTGNKDLKKLYSNY